MLDRVPDLLGERDDPTGFVPHHPAGRRRLARLPGWRVPRSGLVVQALVPAIIEQKVTGKEAFAGYRRLVRRFGEPAPAPAPTAGWSCRPTRRGGPASRRGSGCAPASTRRARAPSCGPCGHAGRLEECADLPADRRPRPAQALPGIGRWTWAEVAQRALGLPDEVSFGDYHVAKNIGWALTGTPVDDDGLAELLEPYAGHRYRVQRLLELAGAFRPRRGPRMAPRTHLPVSGR